MILPWILLHLPLLTSAATADQWRGRSIYQLITDRYALPEGAATDKCDPGAQTWCGGTWTTIQNNLDYIQDAGFTAVWISPVNQNYEGPRTAYGDAYHGYWIADISQINEHFGTSDDLKNLSTELHRRNMYLMVDVVVNNVMATSTTPDYSPYLFNDQSYYHPYCPIEWGNTTSEQNCWLGDTKVALPDLNTSNSVVIERYGDWIQKLVQEYNIDGLRIDAAKHVQMDFWPAFCAKAGVFCMGEVFGGIEVEPVAQYQGSQSLDSVLNYPFYSGLVEAFTLPGPNNVSALVQVMEQSQQQFSDVTLLGNFLENQDIPRWHNLSVDPQTLYNAMVMTFLTDGIPIVYYGQEQGFSGNTDPYNREPLWTSNYQKTATYDLMSTLNKVRNFFVNTTDWSTQRAEILASTSSALAIKKGDIISVVTTLGSPPQNGTHIAVATSYQASTATINILTCQQWDIGASGYIDVEYTKGGVPVVLVPSSLLKGSGVCETSSSSSDSAQSSSAIPSLSMSSFHCTVFLLFLALVYLSS